MKLHRDTAEIFVPDGLSTEAALARTTDLAVSAHQDDIEIMAASPILECFQRTERWFTGVVVTDGRGSPRNGIYAQYDDEQMRLVRFKEQLGRQRGRICRSDHAGLPQPGGKGQQQLARAGPG